MYAIRAWTIPWEKTKADPEYRGTPTPAPRHPRALSVIPAPPPVIPAQAGTSKRWHPVSSVIPAKAGTSKHSHSPVVPAQAGTSTRWHRAGCSHGASLDGGAPPCRSGRSMVTGTGVEHVQGGFTSGAWRGFVSGPRGQGVSPPSPTRRGTPGPAQASVAPRHPRAPPSSPHPPRHPRAGGDLETLAPGFLRHPRAPPSSPRRRGSRNTRTPPSSPRKREPRHAGTSSPTMRGVSRGKGVIAGP